MEDDRTSFVESSVFPFSLPSSRICPPIAVLWEEEHAILRPSFFPPALYEQTYQNIVYACLYA